MPHGPFAAWRWERLFNDFDVFLTGLANTLIISLLALLIALVAGCVLGLASVAVHRLPRIASRIYVEFFQNIPLAIQMFFVYNAYPLLTSGKRADVTVIGVLVVGLYHAAYVSEVFRAGITSIPPGQTEAALSQGFTRLSAMRLVVLPQTIKIVLPPLTNQAVNLIKNTSVLAVIAGGELMYYADTWATNGTLSYGPAYVTAGVMYFLLCFPLASWARHYEEKLKNRDKIAPLKDLEVLDV